MNIKLSEWKKNKDADPDSVCLDVRTIEEFDEGHISSSINVCLLYTSPSPRDGLLSRMPSSA